VSQRISTAVNIGFLDPVSVSLAINKKRAGAVTYIETVKRSTNSNEPKALFPHEKLVRVVEGINTEVIFKPEDWG
jgi:hypothetical protein